MFNQIYNYFFGDINNLTENRKQHNPKIGDIVIFNKESYVIKHVGIIIGIEKKIKDDYIYKIIHITSNDGVSIDRYPKKKLDNDILLELNLNQNDYKTYKKNLIYVTNIISEIIENIKINSKEIFNFNFIIPDLVLNNCYVNNRNISISKAIDFMSLLIFLIEKDNIHENINNKYNNNENKKDNVIINKLIDKNDFFRINKMSFVCSTFIAHIINLALMLNNNNNIYINPDSCSPNDFIYMLYYNKIIIIKNTDYEIPYEEYKNNDINDKYITRTIKEKQKGGYYNKYIKYKIKYNNLLLK